MALDVENVTPKRSWRSFLQSQSEGTVEKIGPSRWNMGILNDKQTIEVPGKQASWRASQRMRQTS